MGKALAILLVLLTAITVWLFAGKPPLWFPENISTDGALIDAQFARTSVVVGAAFVVVQVPLAFAGCRFSRASIPRAAYSPGSKVDAAWTIFTLIVFVTL